MRTWPRALQGLMAACLVLSAIVIQGAATPRVAHAINCGACTAEAGWNGTQYGIETSMSVSPTMMSSTGLTNWNKARLRNHNGIGGASERFIEVGVIQGGVWGGPAYYFADKTSTGSATTPLSTPVSTGWVKLTMWRNTTSWSIAINYSGGSTPNWQGFSNSNSMTGYHASVGRHTNGNGWVGNHAYNYNSWRASGGAWTFQNVPLGGTNSYTNINPPGVLTAGWATYPSASATGGSWVVNAN